MSGDDLPLFQSLQSWNVQLDYIISYLHLQADHNLLLGHHMNFIPDISSQQVSKKISILSHLPFFLNQQELYESWYVIKFYYCLE